MLPALFKLEKLKVEAYKAPSRGLGDRVGEFEAMFNPESFSQAYAVTFGNRQAYSAVHQQARYQHSTPAKLDLTLVLDGTRVDETGAARLIPRPTVARRVDDFLGLAFRPNSSIHEPNFLVVRWGDLKFPCRLGSVNIKYTSFNRDGTPLRAELAVVFTADEDPAKAVARANFNSPDLTHRRVVRAGDTLPLLAREIYGAAKWYAWLAEANGLDHFRTLKPGTELVFPPLAFPAEGGGSDGIDREDTP